MTSWFLSVQISNIWLLYLTYIHSAVGIHRTDKGGNAELSLCGAHPPGTTTSGRNETNHWSGELDMFYHLSKGFHQFSCICSMFLPTASPCWLLSVGGSVSVGLHVAHQLCVKIGNHAGRWYGRYWTSLLSPIGIHFLVPVLATLHSPPDSHKLSHLITCTCVYTFTPCQTASRSCTHFPAFILFCSFWFWTWLDYWTWTSRCCCSCLDWSL